MRGAVDALRRHGASDKQIEIVRVPGAFDLPLVARKLAQSRRYDAIVALGAVIKGATAHFDYVAGECASGLARVANDTGVPVAFGVLTTDTIEQAIERAGTKAGNKGADAAVSALEPGSAEKTGRSQPTASSGSLSSPPASRTSPLARAASRGAVLAITTPNVRSPWPTVEWLLDRSGLVPVMDEAQHLTLFNRGLLRDCCERAGWRIEELGAFNGVAPFLAPISERGARLAERVEFAARSWLPANLLYCRASRPV